MALVARHTLEIARRRVGELVGELEVQRAELRKVRGTLSVLGQDVQLCRCVRGIGGAEGRAVQSEGHRNRGELLA